MSFDWGSEVPPQPGSQPPAPPADSMTSPPGAQIAAAPGAHIPSPIADLSYRNYDGPLRTHAVRWWIVSVATLRAAFRSPIFYIGVILCLLTYLTQGLNLYIQMQSKNNPFAASLPPLKFATFFFNAQCGTLSSYGLLVIVLLVGARSIAADNRANALLVYLSKPITKGDYLLGKWAGLFLTMIGVTLIPSLLFYVYCALTYSNDGFFTQDHWLIGRVLLAALIPPLIHSSLIVGFSAWSKSASIAGAFYAGFYIAGGIIVSILGGLVVHNTPDSPERGLIVQHLSISGVIDGLIQNIFHVELANPFRNRRALTIIYDAPPALWAMLLLAALIIVLGIGAARAKIQAVEVIRG